MSKRSNSRNFKVCFAISIVVSTILLYERQRFIFEGSWTRKAAEEAERVAKISCSGHGRVYLDTNNSTCECHNCYSGRDCSLFDPSCPANAEGGDPLFLEPFWVKKAASSAIVVSGWHRMSYTFNDDTTVSEELESVIRNLHAKVGNAITRERYIVFGAGATQLINAAIRSLSPYNSSSRSKIVASIPFYPLYERQTNLFRSMDFEFGGDTSVWKNKSDVGLNMIEFVTSPNNPDGQLKHKVLQGSNVQVIQDRAYYWPHFTAIPEPADGDMVIFTLTKLTGHAGSRFGWAIVKNKTIYQKMVTYLQLTSMGVSRDTQLRALKLLKVALENGEDDLFQFAHQTMKRRWERLNQVLSTTDRFSLQKIPPQYCTYLNKIRDATPAYAWVKCERDEDEDCNALLQAANIIGVNGSTFYASNRYVRLSLIRSQDDFSILIDKLRKLVSKEEVNGPKSM